jgi:hypothetical protein
MSSTARCGRPEGNCGGGAVRGWWSTSRGAGRLYLAARCSGHGQNGWREAGAGCPRQLSGSAVWGEKQRRKKRCSTVGGGCPAVDEGRRGGETGAEKQRWEAVGVAVGGGRGLEWSARSECGRSVVRTRRLMGGPSGFDIFLKLSKLTQT